jgi:hypothetical protein
VIPCYQHQSGCLIFDDADGARVCHGWVKPEEVGISAESQLHSRIEPLT